MIKNYEELKKLEDTLIRERADLSFSHASAIFEAMWQEGISLGVLPPKDPIEGIETDIQIAKVLNSCLKNSSPK